MTLDASVATFNTGNAQAALTALGIAGPAMRWKAASWLHRTSGLDTTVLGNLLGDPDQVPLMHAYVQKLSCKGLGLLDALRNLLGRFRLPGEAQKIDRIMECFALHWHTECGCTHPPALSHDAAFVVCFALIMLNTDLHNPSLTPQRPSSRSYRWLDWSSSRSSSRVRSSRSSSRSSSRRARGGRSAMSSDAFVHNLRGQGAGGTDLDSAWLRELYASIARCELKLHAGSVTHGHGDDSAAIVPDLDAADLDALKRRLRTATRGALTAIVRMQWLAREGREEGSLTLLSPSDDSRVMVGHQTPRTKRSREQLAQLRVVVWI